MLAKCVYCLRRLRDSYIVCSECYAVKLCIDCFLCGAECGSHIKSHSYSIESPRFSLLNGLFASRDAWQAEEELKLLDAIETYGYGNWSEAALQLRTRTALDCKLHYERFYISGTIGHNTISGPTRVYTHTEDFTLMQPDEPFVENGDTRSDLQKLLGYMPYRDEFEYEHCNDAEQLLISIPCVSTDQLLTELHLALINIYNGHLAERQRRHTIAREHGLVTQFVRDFCLPIAKFRCKAATFRCLPAFRYAKVYRHGRYIWPIKCKRKRGRVAVKPKARSTNRQALFVKRNAVVSSDGRPVTITDGLDRPITCARPQSNRQSIIPTYYPNFNVTAEPGQRTTDIRSTLSRVSPCLDQSSNHDSAGVCHEPSFEFFMGARLTNHNRTKSSHSDDEPNPITCSCAPFTRCLNPCPGTLSTTTSDSGIGSSESCGQSTISTVSSSGDPFARTASSGTANTRIPVFRRPRSNSDSVYGSSSLFLTNKRSPELLTILMELRQQSGSTQNPIVRVEPPIWVAEDNRNPPTTVVSKSAGEADISSPPTELVVVKRRRGRPPRNPVLIAASQGSHQNTAFTSQAKQPNYTSVKYSDWMKPFVRFLSRREMKKIDDNLLREFELRHELDQLADHRRNGVRSMQEVRLRPLFAAAVKPVDSLNGNACRLRSKPTSRSRSTLASRRGMPVGRKVRRKRRKSDLRWRKTTPAKVSKKGLGRKPKGRVHHTSDVRTQIIIPPRRRGRPPKHLKLGANSTKDCP